MINSNKLNLTLNSNNLKTSPRLEKPQLVALPTPWCNIVRVKDDKDLTQKYQNICQNHDDAHKWILMINPESDSLDQLSIMGKIKPEKILKVNANKVNISLEHIKNTLLKGTCSAMILSDAQYDQKQLQEISRCAAQGETQCIILQKNTTKATSQLH
ncbi:MAG: hypothetical protein ACPG52_04500 [Cognaticolwellia sp.]